MFTNKVQIRTQRSDKMIEMIVSSLIIGVALGAILSVMRLTTTSATDPIRDKQALSIAESLLEEIQLQALTFCDPEDANAVRDFGLAVLQQCRDWRRQRGVTLLGTQIR